MFCNQFYNILLTVTYADLKGGAKAIFDGVFSIYVIVIALITTPMGMAEELFTGDWGGLNNITDTLLNQVKTNVITGLSGGAFAIALVFFLIAVIQLATERELTLEYFIKFFSKFIISVGAIMFCDKIVTEVYGLSVAMALFFKGKLSLTGSSTINVEDLRDGLCSMLEKPGILDAVGLAVKCLFIFLILMLAALVIFVVVFLVGFTRILELTVRAAFMPIAVALLADDGWRGAGGRYIRKFVAVCCQSSVLIVIAGLTNQLMIKSFTTFGATVAIDTTVMTGLASWASTAINTIVGGIIGICCAIGAAFAGISLMFKSISIINDVFGG